MKTKTLIIEAQAICLEETTKVFEALQRKIGKLENEGIFMEEPSLELEPYNRGYQIDMSLLVDYLSPYAPKLPGIFRNPFLHPGSFFQEYMEAAGAHIEFGYLKDDPFTKRSSGSSTVRSIGQFRTFSEAWTEGMLKQIQEL